MKSGVEGVIWRVIFLLALLIIIVSVPIQYKALNRIAFGRSMFITFMALLMGMIVAMLPSVAATIVAMVLFLLGFGFMVLMDVKSLQRLRAEKK